MFPTTQMVVIEWARSGEFEPFDRLYRPAIAAWGQRQGLQHADAEALTQTVLVKLWKALRDFNYDPEQGKFRSWLVTVLRRALVDHVRKRKPEPQAVGGTAWEEILQGIEDSVPSLATTIDEKPATAEWEAVCRVRAKVEAITWECFERREIQKQATDEVAKATGKSMGAVHTAVYRVKGMIREETKQMLRERKQNS